MGATARHESNERWRGTERARVAGKGLDATRDARGRRDVEASEEPTNVAGRIV